MDLNCEASLKRIHEINEEMQLVSWSDPDPAHNRLCTVTLTILDTSFETAMHPKNEDFPSEEIPTTLCINCATNNRQGIFFELRKLLNIEHSMDLIPGWLFAMVHGLDGYLKGLYLFGRLDSVQDISSNVYYCGVAYSQGTTAFEVALKLNKNFEMLKRLRLTTKGFIRSLEWAIKHKRDDVIMTLTQVPDVMYVALRSMLRSKHEEGLLQKFVRFCVLKAKRPILYDAIQYKNIGMLKLAVKLGANVNERYFDEGRVTTVLEFMLSRYRPDIVRILCKGKLAPVINIELRCLTCSHASGLGPESQKARVFQFCRIIYEIAKHECQIRVPTTQMCEHILARRFPNHWDIVRILALISVGAKINFNDEHFRSHFEYFAAHYGRPWAPDFLHWAGFRFLRVQGWREAAEESNWDTRPYDYIINLQKQQIPLKQMCFNVLRDSLNTNAISGAKKLNFPANLDITGLTAGQNADRFFVPPFELKDFISHFQYFFTRSTDV